MPDPQDSPGFARGIFLSYASQDAGAARRIAEALTSAGLEVWFDQSELRGGDAWDQKIRRQIKECFLFVPVISAHTQTRAEGYFRLEWHLAEQRSYLMASDEPFIIPVVVDDTPDAGARVPDRFRERQWTRLPGGESSPEFIHRIRQLVGGKGAAADLAPGRHASPEAAVATPAAEKSVAVLAFSNLSGDKENEYFSDGVSDELMTLLQSIPGLRVAARTSAFWFKGRNATAQEIGAKLGVASLVEGSVQRSGNRVKINARLSRASSGQLHWSRSYTREMTDVFALQEELAVAIVGELKGQFGGETGTAADLLHGAARGGTRNVDAHQQYLIGRHLSGQFSGPELRKAIDHFSRAVQLDPLFAIGWASLAQAHTWICGYEGSLSRAQFDEHLNLAREAVERALALEPDLPSGLIALAWIKQAFDYDWKGGEAIIRRAAVLAPADPFVLTMAARMELFLGRIEHAVELARRAVTLDPINPRTRVNYAQILTFVGRFDEARVECARYAELNPGGLFTRSGVGFTFLIEGRYEEAERAVAGEGRDWSILWVRAVACWGQGKREEARNHREVLIAEHGDTAAIQISSVFAFFGETDKAFSWLERARLQRDPGLPVLASSSLFETIRGDPRWEVFWKKMGVDVHYQSPGAGRTLA